MPINLFVHTSRGSINNAKWLYLMNSQHIFFKKFILKEIKKDLYKKTNRLGQWQIGLARSREGRSKMGGKAESVGHR